MNIYTWSIIIVCVITIIVGLYVIFHYNMEPGGLFVIFVLGGLFCMAISNEKESKQPKPIDVYRGKTTLKITYVDSIPQDTLVVWKEYK